MAFVCNCIYLLTLKPFYVSMFGYMFELLS